MTAKIYKKQANLHRITKFHTSRIANGNAVGRKKADARHSQCRHIRLSILFFS